MKNKYKVSVVTAIGKISHYSEFFDRYIENIKEQTMFNDIELVVVYM